MLQHQEIRQVLEIRTQPIDHLEKVNPFLVSGIAFSWLLMYLILMLYIERETR